jgi:hypothetical protein
MLPGLVDRMSPIAAVEEAAWEGLRNRLSGKSVHCPK